MRNKLTIMALLAFFQITGVLAQQTEVTGTVTVASDGMTLPGVNVMEKGTRNGTVTDMDGNYAIEVPADAVLVFSSLGFERQEQAVNGRDIIDVIMTEDLEGLDEVVVTALGITRDRKSLGYATQEVDGENFTLTNEQNVLGSLSGRVAGVQVTGASGSSMGGTQKIKIRGINSLSGGGEPLLVVDGTPISNANFAGGAGADYGNLGQDINPNDIESVNVLKGPTASALYGIRGQYGVIMITTKDGAKGVKDTRVQLSSNVSIERAGNFMPVQNMYGAGSSQSFSTLPNGDPYVALGVDESWGPRMDGTPVRHAWSFYPQDPGYGELAPFSPQPDNIKNFYETGHNINNNISVSGGNENTSYRLSVNDTRIEGVEPNTYLKRNNIGLNTSLDVNDKITVNSNVNYARNDAQRPQQGSEYGTGYFVQWFQRNIDMNKLENYQYADGTFQHWNLRSPSSTTGEITNFSPLYWNNPYFEAYENTNNDRRDRFFGNIGVTYQVLPELELSANVRSDMYTQNIETRRGFGGTGVPGYTVGKYQNTEMNYELLAQYNKEFGDFSLNGTIGGNIFDRRYSYVYQATEGGLTTAGFYNIDASIDRPTTTSYLLRKQIRSGFAMASLGYQDTYFIEASIRNDNSSTLPEENNSYWYPSFSGSMVFSEFTDWKPLTFGKLRASYAQAGSDLAPYQTSKFYTVGTVYNNINTLSVPNSLPNPNILPSFAHSYEIGVDLRFFNNRLGLDATYYEQRNKDQIIDLDISGATGYSSRILNAGEITNNGVELSLTGTPIKTDNFRWDATLNFNRNRSEVVELHPGIDVYQYGSTTYSSVNSYLNSYEGEPFGSLIGQAYQRDEATGQILLDANNMPLYTDATHNFGSVLPDLTGGFQNNIQFGNFNLAAMIDFQKGGQFFSRSKMLAVRTGQDPITVATNSNGANVRDPLEEGGGVEVSGISAETGEEVTAFVDARSYYRNVVGRRIYEEWLYDASYIKLREVRLGYTFGPGLMENLPFEAVNLAFIARNPAMLWQNAPEGIDPSEISTGSQDISWYESGQLISVRSYGLNLNITF
ncbi:SusC/RagA family TonB-linked outer membrane protein [uncultured Salegentibacter sp.]|mgnify:CR=1 FL=1|uniref:SusC/RagA family TonB-linked outer membrane protein n=1 Tax=uncultured Salegentibacter sp. TaxID=259320 RepID=UPI0030D961E9